MVEARLTIHHPAGLHARPAALFVRTAASFDSTVRLTNLTRDPDRDADAKSILSLMTLGVEHEHEILVRAEGPDAQQAIDAIRELVEHNFDEDGHD